jgi:hypothetical protein
MNRLIVSSLLLLSACASIGGRSSSWPADITMRPARDVPPAFSVVGGVQAPVTADDRSCRGRLSDPRRGVELRLQRSQNGMGDYDGAGAYGGNSTELLRINCVNNVAVGLVSR